MEEKGITKIILFAGADARFFVFKLSFCLGMGCQPIGHIINTPHVDR